MTRLHHLGPPLTLCLLTLSAPPHAWANDDVPHPFELTLGSYRYANDQGQDVNLRWKQGDTHAWIGHYQDGSFGKQARIGSDTSWPLNDLVSLQPSLQAATGGFMGGSLNVQVGHDTYGLAGWGRTNLKPYFNLNFDNNDAITLGAGHSFDNGQSWSLLMVRDDRLHTGQTNWHLTGHIPVADNRLSLDLLHKSGQGDSGPVRAWGYTVTWDFPRWSLRLARDPKQSFTADDALRLSVGMRF